MTTAVDAQVFDGRALARFSVAAIAACMFFDFVIGAIFQIVALVAVPVEIAVLLLWTYFLGWWSNTFRYTMKTAGLVLSFILPNIALWLLFVTSMCLEIAMKGLP